MTNRARSEGLYCAVVLLFVSIAVWVHLAAGLTFPVPWPDEAVFVQQAISFEHHNTLFSPSLSDSRHILWMPPGYMVILGTLFKITGSSLFAARFISLLLIIASFALFAWTLRDWPARFFLLVLTGLFFVDKIFIVTGNVARMESLLIFGIVGALVLFLKQRSRTALIVLLALPLVHPNGIYFLCAGLGIVLIQTTYLKQEIRSAIGDKWIFAVVLVLFTCYAAYVVLHWNDFLRDISYQLVRKSRRDLVGPFEEIPSLVFLCVNVFAFVVTLIRKNGKLLVLTLFALSFWLLNKIGQEMWYHVFDVIAFLLLTIVVLVLLNPSRNRAVYGVLTLLSVYVSAELGMIERVAGYPYSLRWYGMGFPADVEYFKTEDVQKIGALLSSHRTGIEPLRTMIYPSGDALLLQDLEGKAMRSLYVTRDTSVFPAQEPDVYLVHISRYTPPGWDWSFLPWVLEDANIDTTDKRCLLFERDGTERWYYRFVVPPGDTIRREVPRAPTSTDSVKLRFGRSYLGSPHDSLIKVKGIEPARLWLK